MPGERVPVVFIHGLWLHSTSWQPWAGTLPRGRLRPGHARSGRACPTPWPRPGEHPESQAGVGIDAGHRPPRRDRRGAAGTAGAGRPLVRRAGGPGAAGPRARAGPGWRSTRRRSAASSACPPAQLALGLPGAAQPGQPQARGEPDRRPVPARFGNALPGGGVRSAARAVDDPRPGRPLFQAALANMTPRGRAATAVDTRTADRGAAADHLGRAGPHRSPTASAARPSSCTASPRGHGVPAVPRPRALADRGLRLVRGGRRGPGLADEQGIAGQTPAP